MVTLAEDLAQIESDIKELEQRRRDIYKLSLEAPEAEKVCEDHLAEMLGEIPFWPSLEYPIEVSGINMVEDTRLTSSRKGTPLLVAVRPVDTGSRTYVGIYVGNLPLGYGAHYHPESKVLSLEATHHNPAIIVPELKRIVMGCESWWGPIKTEADLQQITDKDIGNVWYVQALRKMVEGE
jgi:hypothetical protein